MTPKLGCIFSAFAATLEDRREVRTLPAPREARTVVEGLILAIFPGIGTYSSRLLLLNVHKHRTPHAGAGGGCGRSCIGEPHREGFTSGEMPGSTAATGRIAQLAQYSQPDQCRSSTPWFFHWCQRAARSRNRTQRVRAINSSGVSQKPK